MSASSDIERAHRFSVSLRIDPELAQFAPESFTGIESVKAGTVLSPVGYKPASIKLRHKHCVARRFDLVFAHRDAFPKKVTKRQIRGRASQRETARTVGYRFPFKGLE
jgi:hypothetical protein